MAIAVSVAATAALVVGIGIGGLAQPLLRPLLSGAASPSVTVAQAPAPTTFAPALVEEISTPPVATAEAPSITSPPLRAAALVLQKPGAIRPSPVQKTVGRAGPCPSTGSRADLAVCADPTIAAMDREVRRAPTQRDGGEIEWLLAREEAARRSPAELAAAYRRRIAELGAAAADEPPH